MYRFPYESAGDTRYPPSAGGPRRGGLARMIVTAVAVGIVISLLLGPALWALGLAFHLVGLAIRLAVLGAIGIFLWHRISRRLRSGRGI